jgi:GYF domain 2
MTGFFLTAGIGGQIMGDWGLLAERDGKNTPIPRLRICCAQCQVNLSPRHEFRRRTEPPYPTGKAPEPELAHHECLPRASQGVTAMRSVSCIFCYTSIDLDDQSSSCRIECPKCKLLTPVSSGDDAPARHLGSVDDPSELAAQTGEQTMAQEWFYTKDGKSKIGPVSSADLQALAKSGQLLPTDMVLKAGRAQWTTASKIKGLFAKRQSAPKASPPPKAIPINPLPPVVTPPRVPVNAAATAFAAHQEVLDVVAVSESSEDLQVVEAAVASRSQSGRPKGFWGQLRIGTKVGIIGGGVGTGVLLLLVIFLVPDRGGSGGEGNSKPGGGDWGSPIRINKDDGTTFLVGLKDGWWTDLYGFGETEKKTFVLVYYSKNLGPREGWFSLGRVEIKTDKGHIFSDEDGGRIGEAQRDVGGWSPKRTDKIDETSQSALIFRIPKDEFPTELINRHLAGKLPQRNFGTRRYTERFGFLPEKAEEAVPGLILALEDNDNLISAAAIEILGQIGPAAKGAVPALTKVLLSMKPTNVGIDDYLFVPAAKALGQIGPSAKEALPALEKRFNEYKKRWGPHSEDIANACSAAISQIKRGP